MQPHRYIISWHKTFFQPFNMTQFQILEYEEIWGIIVQMSKSAMDKIVTPPEESVRAIQM